MGSNNCKIFKHQATKMFFPTPKQFRKTCKSQEFRFQMPLMKYIWSNPSTPEVYQKLIKCCKIFFIKNQIVVLKNLMHCSSNGWKYCDKNECGERTFCKVEHKEIDMNKLKGRKIWVSKRFRVFDNTQNRNFVSAFIPRIYRYDVQVLTLTHQNLLFNEFKFLSIGVKECHMSNNIIQYENGENVSLENMIKLFSGGKEFYNCFGNRTANTTCECYDELVDILNTFEAVVLTFIPAVFDIQKFFQHLKERKNRTLITLHFLANSDHIEEIITEILETTFFEFVPPVIKHYQLNSIQIEKMQEIRKTVAAKYL